MIEYAFVRTGSCLLRVFGSTHPTDSVHLLLRYFHEDGVWRKPPLFGTETFTGDILGRYDLPLQAVAVSGITMGIGPATKSEYGAYFDPLDDDHHASTAPFSDAAGVPIGLTGSRLVGLANPASDLDLVIYSDDHATGRQLVSAHRAGDWLPAMSSTFRRMTALAGPDIPQVYERNIFKGIACVDGHVVKLDLHYASRTSIEHRPETRAPTMFRQRAHEPTMFTVVNASQRHLFPGLLCCTNRDGQLIELWIKDHLLSLLLPGDEVAVVTNEIVVGDDTWLVGSEVIALCLR